MKELVKIFIILDLICLIGLAYKFNSKLQNLKSKNEIEYEYTDYLGNKGTSKHCFEENNINVCRVGKTSKKVLKIEKKEISKNERK